MKPIFISVVLVVENNASELSSLLGTMSERLTGIVNDYELIIVDNASTDNTLQVMRGLVGMGGLANLQVYGLTKRVDVDIAAWAGIENALGDFVVTMDLNVDQFDVLPAVLDKACNGCDIVTVNAGSNESRPSITQKIARSMFSKVYRGLTGIDLENESSPFRLLSRRVINYILQHPMPAMKYRFLPTTGFTSEHMQSSDLVFYRRSELIRSIDRAIKLLVTTTRVPMRLVTGLCLFGAVMNVIYIAYVVGVVIIGRDTAPGWVTMSLQLSGMFFLLSLVLLVLGEYVLQVASFSSEGPSYHVGQEYTSARMTRNSRLNIEER